MIIGRSSELQSLEAFYKKEKSSLIVVYGRRRIGKSFLVHQYLKKHLHIHFEGIENQPSSYQIRYFTQELLDKVDKTKLKQNRFRTWEDTLNLLTEYFKQHRNQKIVVFFDEYQWMSGGRTKLTSLLKKYWDNDWKKFRIQLILCGSVSSFMVKKVIKSKALYGRVSAEYNIEQLPPADCIKFFKKDKSSLEMLQYLLVFGGVPKYLEEIDQKQSFEQNISRLFFQKNSSYLDEYEKIFYSQFKEHLIYEKIITHLSKNALTLEEISNKIGMESGGGLKSYLENLERAQFIKGYHSSPENLRSKYVKYKIIDPFLNFYLTFVAPNRALIKASGSSAHIFRTITNAKINVYFGIAFENFCNLFALHLAQSMSFLEEVISFGPLLQQAKKRQNIDGFQIDLAFFRENKTITLCEIKYSKEQIAPQIIAEMETKVNKLKLKYPDYSVQKALITTIGPTKSLKASEYFDHILTIQDILN